MPRAPTFHYQNPMGDIGSSLVRAIFGDPQAAQAQQKAQAEAELRDAQARQANEHAALYRAQTGQQEIKNTASSGVPEFIARLSAPPQTVPTLDDPGFLEGVGTAPPVPTADEQFRSNLGPAVAAMAQMNGDKVDPRQVIGTLASFFGGDEMAARGLAAQGRVTGPDFAVTPGRADKVAARNAGAKQSLAESVAGINNRDDVPVANIQAGASRYGADKSAGASMYGADARASASRYATDAKGVGAAAKPGKGGKAAADKPPKRVNTETQDLIDDTVDDLVEGTVFTSLYSKAQIKSAAAKYYQQSGNIPGSALRALEEANAAYKRRSAAPPKGKPAASGGDNHMTVEQASMLKKGTRFIGMDGVARVRQ